MKSDASGRPRTADVIEALRPRQWVKNVLVAAAPAAAGTLDDPDVALKTVGAVVAFIVASAATYLGNDAADAAVDRRHPTRRHRPVASGRISPSQARVGAGAGALVSIGMATLIAPEFALVIVAYLAVNTWYSLGMKHIPGLELAAIAAGFVLRAVAGGSATDTPLSVAFIVVVCSVSLVIVAGKRGAELARTDGIDGRLVLAHYSIRGLRLSRVLAAGTAVVAYALWVFARDGENSGVATAFAAASLLPFAAALAIYERSLDAGLGEDPEDILLGEPLLQIAVAAWCVSFGASVYG